MNFTSYWHYKPTNAIHADSPVLKISKKVLNLSTIDKIHWLSDVLDGSLVCGKREPLLFSFVLNKPSGYKDFHQPKTVQFRKNKSVLNTIAFFLEDDNNEEVDCNGETVTFT